MVLNFNEFLAVVYADIFNWPLSPKEAKKWAISTDKISATNFRHGKYRHKIKKKFGFYYLAGRENLLAQRTKANRIQEKKEKRAREVAQVLGSIGFISGIFLTGSVAAGSASEKSDIDLMIICRPNSLWITRLLVVGILKWKKWYRKAKETKDLVCANIFLEEGSLRIKERNLYTAHEILQAREILGKRGLVKEWLSKNGWAKDFLPRAYQELWVKAGKETLESTEGREKYFLSLVNLGAYWGQYWYMRKKITNEKIGLQQAFFHPNQLAEKIEEKFKRKVMGMV